MTTSEPVDPTEDRAEDERLDQALREIQLWVIEAKRERGADKRQVLIEIQRWTFDGLRRRPEVEL